MVGNRSPGGWSRSTPQPKKLNLGKVLIHPRDYLELDQSCQRLIGGVPYILFEVHNKKRPVQMILSLTMLIDSCKPIFSPDGKLEDFQAPSEPLYVSLGNGSGSEDGLDVSIQ